MSNSNPPVVGRKSPVALTVGSRIRVESAGSKSDSIISAGTYLGLVSIGGTTLSRSSWTTPRDGPLAARG